MFDTRDDSGTSVIVLKFFFTEDDVLYFDASIAVVF